MATKWMTAALAAAAMMLSACAASPPPATASDSLAPTKPTQSINSVQGGDRLNNTQPTDTSNPTKR